MVDSRQLAAKVDELNAQLKRLILEGENIQAKIFKAKDDQNLPPYVLSNLETERRELASKILKIHNQIDNLNKDLDRLRSTN